MEKGCLARLITLKSAVRLSNRSHLEESLMLSVGDFFIYNHSMGKKLEWAHGLAAVFFVLVWIAATFLGWLSSVAFVSHMSMIALVYAALSAWQGARAEKASEDDE